MAAAVSLAARGLGGTWPNPSVGCVIVDTAGRVVGRGRTGLRGRPHAESHALAMAGDAARGGTAYVTLEPCSHHGQTPPCAEALIAAGLSRVVVAAGDPDPRVDGQGISLLRTAGIEVVSGFMSDAAHEMLAGFFTRIRLGRPLVTLKIASTLDGRIATAGGESQWITGDAARQAVHALRGRHDAVMTGIGTVLADEPDLTCRLPGYARRPTVRIVADGFLRMPRDAHLVTNAHHAPTWILYHTNSLPEGVSAADAQPGEIQATRAQLLAEAGARCIPVPKSETGIDLPNALSALGTRGLTRILVEGGAKLAAALLHADLVDRIVWFHAPALLGGDALSALQALGVDRLSALRRFTPAGEGPRRIGPDMMSEYTRL